MEYTSGDETCESSGENVTGIENGDARCNLFASVEDSEKVHSSRVVRSFCNTEEEADKQKTDEVVTDGGQGRYDGPQSHTDAHVVRGSNASQEHIRGNLSQQITNEENADAGEVLCSWLDVFVTVLVEACGLRVAVNLRSSSRLLRRARAIALRSR